jgi:glutaminyl-peptide cyclotransferase
MRIIFLAVLIVLLFSCNQEVVTNPNIEPSPNEKVDTVVKFIPHVHRDSIYYFVKRQVDFGPRVPGTVAHKKCGDFLVQTLQSFSPNPPHVIEQETSAQTFDNKTIPVRNIIAAFYPDRKKRILLAAHWDTRPFAEMDEKKPHKPIDGANDGASGVGVLLEIARQISMHDPGIGIDIIFFDAEDWGDTSGMLEDTYCLGSQYWAQNPHVPGYFAQYGILLDMVGGKNALFAIEENSWRMAKPIVEKVWTKAAKLGYSDLFIKTRRGAIIDDHYYVMKYRQFPMIDIINYDPSSYSRFGHFWHTHDDGMENIDADILLKVAHTVTAVIYSEK